MTQDLGIETLVIHYESYKSKFGATAFELLSFLELPRKFVNKPPDFDGGKQYSNYYTVEEREKRQ